MRRVLTALAMLAACVFIAAPAIAQEDAAGSTEPGTSDANTPEETPPSEEPPPVENLLPPPADEGEVTEPETAAEPEDGEVGALAKDPDKVKNITICHRTNSETNPYRVITVSAFSIVKDSGHDSHNGPVFEPGLKEQMIKWGDIIPEFDYSEGHYDGQNLDEGSDILANGCQVPGEEDDDDGNPGDDDGDDDGDDGDDGDDDDKGNLPATGGGSPWILLTGGLLTVLGIAMLTNGSMGRMQGSVAGRHVKL